MAMDADVRLLIGVARGGADGDSEALIRKELNEIMGKIKLEAKLDSKSFGEQIRKQLDAISKNGKFYVNLSKINIGAGAIADFRRQLNTVINTLNLDKGTSITLTAEGIGEVKSKIKETATVTDEAARKMAEFNVQIAAMKKQSKNIDTGLGSLSKGATAEEAAQVTALLERYKAWQVEFETLRLQGVDGSNERRKALEDEAAAILVNIQRINEEREATAEAAQAKVQAEREAKAADDATVTAENRKNAAMKQGVMLLTQMQKAEQDWTAAQSGRSSEHYNNIRQGTVYLQEYLGQLERGEISVDEFQRRLAGLRTSFAESSNAIKSAGENTKTLSERVGGLAAKFTSWLTVSQIVMKLYSSLKKMVSAVIDIDTAMTELKKVTDETSTVYAKYLDDASVRAKKLGATIADTVTASADFARLGYTLDEAAQLADAALVYKNVGDGIEDVSQASESIISTMKAFGIEAENAISIVDKFNEVGNNFAISSEGVGEALRRSASALAAGNNTLDESIALITAANSVVQDADVVGTTMKTVSMYLRAAKTEAEEAGESTEGMANSVSELREELLALTNGKVDIQIDENTFKSTYQIMKELADVWGELTDITQANILEQIGGKRNANVVSSMLENFNVAEDVVKTAANSAGSALKENEKYLDSINGKIAEFKATFEELSMTLIDSDFVKQVIEFGTGLLDVLNVLAKVIDKVGGLNTVLYVTVGILATIKADAIKTFLVTTIPSALAKVTSAVSTFVTGFKQLPAVIKAMNSQTALAIPGTSRLSVALKTLGISASTAQIAVAGIAAAIGAILLIKNAIEDARTKRIEEAASTIASTEATIENADAVKAAYIEYEKYANRTDLTESEEASFKTALDKVTSALGDKAVALEGLTQGTKDYTEALDGAIKKELEEAQLAAKEKRVAAEKKLQSETWSGWDGSKISYNIQDAWTDEEYVKAKEAAQKIASDYLREKVSSVGYGLAATELVLEPVDWNVDHSNMDAVVDYYYTLLDLKAELLRQDLTGNEIYDAVIEKTGLLKDSVDTYAQSIYDETSATYVLQNGIPTTVEELEKFRTYVSQLELDISSYEKAIAQIDGQIAALQALKNAPLKSFESSSGSSGSGGSSKEVEEYLADIDEYYEAMKRLESIQQRLAKLQSQIEYADTEEEKIALTKQLINVYNDEADALENLNSLRSETIANGKAELEALGFSVSYDATTNEFMVHNMEHLNELYGATQEETNELRKKTEELIDTMESLNDSNQEGASSLRTLKADIKSAKQSIIDYLKQIVTAASDVVDAYQNVYETLHNAANEYAANGYITIDTLQSIIELGAQYMQYLMDENGLLVINEENINKVLAAKTQELALNQAMTYVERLRLALQENSIEDLNNLLYATTEATNATWGLVYANLALLGLDDDQYQAALHNINAIRSLADSAVSGIGQTAGKTAEELNNMKDGLDDILKYVMDMLKQRINDQIDALEDMKDAYADIISLRKEALEAAKSEADYQDKVAEKVKALAKLQARINALSLDDSRDAQAQKAKLEEEMSQLQKELADTQSDYAVDAQKSALDNMQKAYEEQKNAEIKVLEDSISSYQKLYDMAIAYIQSNWGSLYDELIAWNYQYGDELSSTITTAWENALAAAQRYGSYVNALNSIGADIDAANGAGSNYIVGETTYDNSSSNEEMIHAIIKEMYANSQAHHTASKEEKARLDKRNLTLGAMLGQYGVNAYRQNGTWYVDGGALLYEKYRKYIYHTGGIAGDQPTLKQNEILAVLEKGEAVLDAKKEAGLYRIIDFTTALSDKLSKLLTLTDMSRMFGQMQGDVTKAASAFAPINNTQAPSVSFGDVIIYGANEETVEKHREINRQFTNDVIKQLNIKR